MHDYNMSIYADAFSVHCCVSCGRFRRISNTLDICMHDYNMSIYADAFSWIDYVGVIFHIVHCDTTYKGS